MQFLRYFIKQRSCRRRSVHYASSEIVKETDWIFSETLQLQETMEVCTEGRAG